MNHVPSQPFQSMRCNAEWSRSAGEAENTWKADNMKSAHLACDDAVSTPSSSADTALWPRRQKMHTQDHDESNYRSYDSQHLLHYQCPRAENSSPSSEPVHLFSLCPPQRSDTTSGETVHIAFCPGRGGGCDPEDDRSTQVARPRFPNASAPDQPEHGAHSSAVMIQDSHPGQHAHDDDIKPILPERMPGRDAPRARRPSLAKLHALSPQAPHTVPSHVRSSIKSINAYSMRKADQVRRKASHPVRTRDELPSPRGEVLPLVRRARMRAMIPPTHMSVRLIWRHHCTRSCPIPALSMSASCSLWAALH